MSIIEKYLELRNKVVNDKKDFNQLDNVNESNVYRLHYISYYKGTNGKIYTQYMSDAFRSKLPMDNKEVSEVVSYILNYMEKASGVSKYSYSGAKLCDFIINSYDEFNFELVPHKDIKEVKDLFIVDGDKKAFKKSYFYSRYFDWYNQYVRLEDIEKIFDKYGINFDLEEEHKLDLKK